LAKVITERIKPILKQIIGTEQQGFIEGGDISGNLILVKEVIEFCKEKNVEAYIILMDFMKAYDRIDRETIEITLREMNFGEPLIEMIKLLYENSQAVVVTNDIMGEIFQTRGGVKQGCPLSPYLFIIVLELMAIEMREEKEMKGIIINERDRNITSVSNKTDQKDNRDDRLSMFADDSSTIVTDVKEVRVAK